MIKLAETQMHSNLTLEHIKEKIRIVEVTQNSWEEENLLLLTTLDDEQIKVVLLPLLEEERNDENGEVLYDNETMTQYLNDKYPNEICIYYQTPDDLEI
jgi:hypothetical protein